MKISFNLCLSCSQELCSACLNNTYNVHIAMLHTPIEVHKFDDEESHVWFSHHTALVVFVAKSEWYPVLSIRNFSLKNI